MPAHRAAAACSRRVRDQGQHLVQPHCPVPTILGPAKCGRRPMLATACGIATDNTPHQRRDQPTAAAARAAGGGRCARRRRRRASALLSPPQHENRCGPPRASSRGVAPAEDCCRLRRTSPSPTCSSPQPDLFKAIIRFLGHPIENEHPCLPS